MGFEQILLGCASSKVAPAYALAIYTTIQMSWMQEMEIQIIFLKLETHLDKGPELLRILFS